ncbi:hypothetical protein QJQ45_013221 [Haematococcus lacustris]|nr:hypothetical protein QJQ45_013221 [Haematococcus lacustris]
MSAMSVDGASNAGDAGGSSGIPTYGSRFSSATSFGVKHPLPSSGTVLSPYELDRSFQCVQSALHVLCDDAELSSDRALALVLRKLPSRAAAAFSDGYVKHSVIQEYQARYEELDDESALDSAQCIEMFLAIVRDDLADPVLLKQQVQGMRLGDTGDSGRTEAPASLLARMSPQLVRMTEQGHLSRLGAVNMFIIALQPHPRHVLHPQGQAFVQRSKAAFARLAMPHHSEDSVELALGRAETAATQVYNELVGMLQLDQAAGKPTVAIGVNTTDLLGQLKGGDASAVKAAQRLMKQLGNALHASMPPPRPAQSQLQWCENHQRWTGHSTAECHIGMQGQPRPAPSTAPTHVNASSPQPAEYQRVMDRCVADAGLIHCCKAYIDDLLVHSTTAEQHLIDVTAALRMLQATGLKAHPDKSVFGADVVEYLGHNVSSHGLSPTEAKVAAVTALPTPTCLHDLRQIMGFINYYRCYVPNFSAIAAPITHLTSKGAPWVWGEEHQQAFATLKAAICTPGLVLRRADHERPFVLHTDWSTAGCGAVLGQVDDVGMEYMVACVSRSNNKHERNYSSYQGEMLCAVWAIKTLRPYLHGASFRLVTDHQPLTWLMTNPNLTGHHARWALSLQDYTFTIEHRPGNKHQNADVLSRWPLPGSLDGTGAQLDPDPAAALACFPSPTPTANVVWACASYWPFDSDYATHPADLLWGNLGGDLDATRHPPAPPALPDPTAVLHSRIAAMCQLAAPTLATLPPAVTFAGMSVGQRDAHGVAQPVRLNTCCIAGTFCPAATHGMALWA